MLSISMIKFILLFLLSFSSIHSSNKLCSPKLIKSYDEIKNKLKICDPGDKIIVKYNYNLQKEILISQICDLRFSVISNTLDENINLRATGLIITCIFQPTFTNIN